MGLTFTLSERSIKYISLQAIHWWTIRMLDSSIIRLKRQWMLLKEIIREMYFKTRRKFRAGFKKIYQKVGCK